MSKILLIYWSKTGNTKTFVDYFVNNSYSQVDVINATRQKVDANILDDYDKICIGSYSWNNGKIPARVKQFIVDNTDKFKNKDVFIFGSGNSTYPKFCAAVDNISIIMSDLNCNVHYKVKIDQQFHLDSYTDNEVKELNSAIKTF